MFKYCHSCGGEFQLAASICPDCNEPLHLDPPRPGQEAPTDPAAPLEDLVLVRMGEPWELRRVAVWLQTRGIASQIDVYPPGGEMARGSRAHATRLGIYVARADLDDVRELGVELGANEPSEENGEGSHDAAACPACGEPTPENAAACPSCGLEFPEIEPDAGR